MEAVEHEKLTAIFPRVIILPSLLDKIKKLPHPDRYCLFSRFINMDFDGISFISWLFYVLERRDTGYEHQMILKMKNAIQNQLNIHKNNLKIVSIWCWLANYFDSHIDNWNSNNTNLSVAKFDLKKSYQELTQEELSSIIKITE